MLYGRMFQEAEVGLEFRTQVEQKMEEVETLVGEPAVVGGRQVVKFCLCQLAHAVKARKVPGGMCCILT
eukprot:4826560-Ditylum_brightwellii.AAC.1